MLMLRRKRIYPKIKSKRKELRKIIAVPEKVLKEI